MSFKYLKGEAYLKFVMEIIKREEAKEKLPVIKLEIDYELMTLYDALQANDSVQIIKSKERLKFLATQLTELKKWK
uniref:Hypopthetical protein n=1 Tax=uncultured bacterium pBIO2160 TaxID=1478047 RepID=A0A075FAE4_9BACT|nr:hypopthetical protein [uncultured bacterium pBIO2160]